MNPWAILALVLAVSAGLGGVYAKGHSDGVDSCEADHAQAQQDWQDKLNAAAATHETERARLETELATIEAEYERLVSINGKHICSLNATQRRLWNDANKGAYSGQP